MGLEVSGGESDGLRRESPWIMGCGGKMATVKQGKEGGASNYLLKTEPSEYSFADLQKDKETIWDGVSNPVALRNLREMKPGTRLVIYETGDQKTAVGTASVVSVDASNPKNPEVEIKAGKALAKPVTLAQIKSDPLFAASPLVRQGRLSVVPLTDAQYKKLTGE
jgi:predicted RNA-binding protein with PUA-like domain